MQKNAASSRFVHVVHTVKEYLAYLFKFIKSNYVKGNQEFICFWLMTHSNEKLAEGRYGWHLSGVVAVTCRGDSCERYSEKLSKPLPIDIPFNLPLYLVSL